MKNLTFAFLTFCTIFFVSSCISNEEGTKNTPLTVTQKIDLVTNNKWYNQPQIRTSSRNIGSLQVDTDCAKFDNIDFNIFQSEVSGEENIYTGSILVQTWAFDSEISECRETDSEIVCDYNPTTDKLTLKPSKDIDKSNIYDLVVTNETLTYGGKTYYRGNK